MIAPSGACASVPRKIDERRHTHGASTPRGERAEPRRERDEDREERDDPVPELDVAVEAPRLEVMRLAARPVLAAETRAGQPHGRAGRDDHDSITALASASRRNAAAESAKLRARRSDCAPTLPSRRPPTLARASRAAQTSAERPRRPRPSRRARGRGRRARTPPRATGPCSRGSETSRPPAVCGS